MSLALYFYYVILILCFLAGLTVYFRKAVPVYLKFFPPFLLLTIIIEIIARIMAIRYGANQSLYSFFEVFEFAFYFFVLHYIIRSKRGGKIILFTAWLYPV